MKWTSVRFIPTIFIWWANNIPPIFPPPFERGAIGLLSLGTPSSLLSVGKILRGRTRVSWKGTLATQVY